MCHVTEYCNPIGTHYMVQWWDTVWLVRLATNSLGTRRQRGVETDRHVISYPHSRHRSSCWRRGRIPPRGSPRLLATSMLVRWWWMPWPLHWDHEGWTSWLWTAMVGLAFHFWLCLNMSWPEAGAIIGWNRVRKKPLLLSVSLSSQTICHPLEKWY